MTTILVAGPLANKPRNGGAAWVRLSWVLGLRRLGLDVWFVEEIAADSCFDKRGRPTDFEDSVNLEFFRHITTAFDLGERAVLLCGERSSGLSLRDVTDLAGSAALLVNITGHLTIESIKGAVARRIYVDLDPGFTQLWQAAGNLGARLRGHEFFYTVGTNIGTAGNPIPTDGVEWRPIQQPVLLDEWPVAPKGGDRFTTVGAWRGPYGPIDHEGKRYGLKAHQFRRFIELPQRAGPSFELAVEIHDDDRADRLALEQHGWRIVDPKVVAPDPQSFRTYVQDSAAEFSVAQGMYVETNCGWFSDRSTRYLASGRPVLVQDTGFSRTLPTGEGLLTFRTMEEAIAGAEEIAANYSKHATAARAIAEQYFDSDIVLGRLLEEIGVAP